MVCNSITVIVPIYLVEQYLDDCIKSLIGQTVPFNEILLIVDGSPDHCLEICKKYEKNYTNIKVMSKENEGLSATRNLGIIQAKSEYVVFVDGDDYIDSRYVEILQPYLQKGDLEVLCFDAREIYEVYGVVYKKIYNRGRYLSKSIFTGYEYFQHIYPRHYVVSSCISAYKKSMLLEHQLFFPVGILYEDTLFTFSVLNIAERLQYIPAQLYIRRYRENSIMTSVMNEKKFSDLIEVHLLLWKSALQFYRAENERKDFYRIFLCHCMIATIYRMNFQNSLQIDLARCKFRLLDTFWRVQKELGILEDAALLTWGENNAALIAINEMKRLRGAGKEIDQMIVSVFENDKNFRKLEEILSLNREKQLRNKLLRLPLENKNNNIVIYGIGKHTQKLLALYESEVGPICCRLDYAVTQAEAGLSYNGKNVFCIGNIPADTDAVVISSYYYEDEMKEYLIKHCSPKIEYFSLYDKNDICDILDLDLNTMLD